MSDIDGLRRRLSFVEQDLQATEREYAEAEHRMYNVRQELLTQLQQLGDRIPGLKREAERLRTEILRTEQAEAAR